MKDPHMVLDFENWWDKKLGNMKPYRIPKLADDIIAKLQLRLDNTAERIWRTRIESEAANIIQSLQNLIDSHKQVVFNCEIVGLHFLLQDYFNLFDLNVRKGRKSLLWNLSIFKKPPVKKNQQKEYTPEEVDMINR